MMNIAVFLNTFIPMMKAVGVTEPQHRTVAHGEDAERVVSAITDLVFKPSTEIHFATMMVKGRKVTIVAIQDAA